MAPSNACVIMQSLMPWLSGFLPMWLASSPCGMCPTSLAVSQYGMRSLMPLLSGFQPVWHRSSQCGMRPASAEISQCGFQPVWHAFSDALDALGSASKAVLVFWGLSIVRNGAVQLLCLMHRKVQPNHHRSHFNRLNSLGPPGGYTIPYVDINYTIL